MRIVRLEMIPINFHDPATKVHNLELITLVTEGCKLHRGTGP